jgi:hypothetical protein
VPWTQVDEQPAREGLPPLVGHVKSFDGLELIAVPSYKTLRLVTWRCLGCRALAVTGGQDPGACLRRPCRYYKGE